MSSAGARDSAEGPRQRRGRRFFVKVLIANVLALAVTLGLAELGVRVWREGGVVAGVRSLVSDRPLPRNLGTGDWLASDPERGYVLAAGRNGVNALHIRHAELLPRAAGAPQQAHRLLLLGDSVAWPDSGFAALLQRDCDAAGGRRVDVVNAAVPGYTTWQERHHLEAIVAGVDPDAVVLQYCCNDNHRFLHQLTGDGGWLITEEARRAVLPEGRGWLGAIARWSYLALEVRRLLVGRREVDPLEPWRSDPAFAAAWREDSWPLVEGEIARMQALLRARGVPFALLAVPYAPQLADAVVEHDPDRACTPQRHLAALCRRLGVPFLDLFAAFRSHRADDLFTDGIHLTANGHALVCAELRPFLLAQGLLPPR